MIICLLCMYISLLSRSLLLYVYYRNEKSHLEAELQGATLTIDAKDMSLSTLQESILTLTEKFEILDSNSRDNRDELLKVSGAGVG